MVEVALYMKLYFLKHIGNIHNKNIVICLHIKALICKPLITGDFQIKQMLCEKSR